MWWAMQSSITSPRCPDSRVVDDQALGGVAHDQAADAEEVGIAHQGAAVVDVPIAADDRTGAVAIGADFRPVVLGAAGRDVELLVEDASAAQSSRSPGPRTRPLTLVKSFQAASGDVPAWALFPATLSM